jgi:hypothetical protein
MQSLSSLQWNSHNERQLFGSSSDLSVATVESYKQRHLAINFMGIYCSMNLRKFWLHKRSSFCILMPWLHVVIVVIMCQRQRMKLIGSECWAALLISRQHVTVCNFQPCYRAYLCKHVNNNDLFTQKWFLKIKNVECVNNCKMLCLIAFL